MIPALAAFMAGGDSVISVLNALADSGALNDTNALGSFSVSPGSNRLLVAAQHLTGSADDISDLTWGGESMAERIAVVSGGGFQARVKIWTLNEAGIAAASGTAFGLTGGVNGSYACTAVALSNVDQAAPIVDSGSGILDVDDPADIVLSTVEGGYAIAALMFDHNVSGANVSWGADFTERVNLETSPTGNTWSSADAITDGNNVTADPTTSRTTAQQCQAAISFRPA